jgi:NO-binding membrane sensor protein with MHYT domain
MGLGIWSMHFVGMLAFNLPVPVGYRWPTIFLLLLIVIVTSAVPLFVATRKKMGLVQALTGRSAPRAPSGGGHHEPDSV